MLKFNKGNSKVGKQVWTFSIPAGHTCPAARDCFSKANRLTGKITDGPDTEFRCFAASLEAIYKNLRQNVWHNFESLRGKTQAEMAELITSSLPKAQKIRVHVSGDFFNEDYFLAWRQVAAAHPNILFYGYTKRIDLLLKYGQCTDNFKMVASRGGKYDHLIGGLVEALVVYSEKEAEDLGLEIDHDDTHAMYCTKSFALLIHGVQPAGSKAASALRILKTNA